MKPSVFPILAACLAFSGAAQAADRVIEIRLLKTSGAVPTEATLRSIVEDPGAQAAAATSKALPAEGSVKIEGTTPFRFASEYTMEGEPSSFETTDLGTRATVATSMGADGKLQLELDLESKIADAPVVYEVDGVQVTMPVFHRVASGDARLQVTPGEWAFLSARSGEVPMHWAIRVTDAGGK